MRSGQSLWMYPCTGSGWDVSLQLPMQCCALHMELEQHWYHTSGVSAAEQLKKKKWERNITRAADLNQPKGYFIPYDVTLSNKRWKKEGEQGWALVVKMLVLLINGYVRWGPASRTFSSIAHLWEVESNFFPLHFYTAFAFFFFCFCFCFVLFFSLFPFSPFLFFPFS